MTINKNLLTSVVSLPSCVNSELFSGNLILLVLFEPLNSLYNDSAILSQLNEFYFT